MTEEMQKMSAGIKMSGEPRDIMNIREIANKRNTINIKKGNMSRVLTKLKALQSTDHSKIKKITREDNKEDLSVVRTEKKVVRSEISTKMENIKHPNKNTAVIIEATKNLRNLCLFDKKAIEKNQIAPVHLLAAIPTITSRNKSSIGVNTHMIAKPITKNSTRAAAHEAITDLWWIYSMFKYDSITGFQTEALTITPRHCNQIWGHYNQIWG